jgi:hypothetical protein
MGTYYIEDGNNGNQYYFNSHHSSASHSFQNQPSTMNSSYPVGHLVSTRAPQQSIRVERSNYDYDDSYRLPTQHQSVAGFSKNASQQHYQSAVSSSTTTTTAMPPPQVRARMRSVGSQDQSRSQPSQVSAQQHHFHYDSRYQPGQPTGPAVVYQTPGAAQFTHRNVDLWTESSSRGRDPYVQVIVFVEIGE